MLGLSSTDLTKWIPLLGLLSGILLTLIKIVWYAKGADDKLTQLCTDVLRNSQDIERLKGITTSHTMSINLLKHGQCPVLNPQSSQPYSNVHTAGSHT